jgi:hypothetical protein
MLTRFDKTNAHLQATLEVMGERIEANTEEVRAQTQAIIKLVDRFEDPEGRPPV